PLQNEDVQSFRQRLQQLEDELRDTEKQYHDRADVFELQAKDKLLMQKVQDALNPQYGLARPALKLLLESDISTFGSDGAEIELRLLMLIGEVEDGGRLVPGMEKALEMLKEKDPNRPDVPAALALLDPGKYYFLLTLAEAATGHYAEAGKALDYLIDGLERRNVNDAIDTMRFHTFSGMGPSLLVQWLMESPAHSREIAEYHVMRGLLALEAGDNQTAAKHFRSAIGPGDPAGPQTSPLAFEGRPIAVRYLKELNKYRPVGTSKPSTAR
ncbi:MAG TPA: hypothetical protein VKI65_14605, partial [Gemmataceae bacterium]|nr:hypothetical protein [Gemmataceae bacterium]